MSAPSSAIQSTLVENRVLEPSAATVAAPVGSAAQSATNTTLKAWPRLARRRMASWAWTSDSAVSTKHPNPLN